LKQYVEGLSGEHACRQACRSSESAIAAETLINNAGYEVKNRLDFTFVFPYHTRAYRAARGVWYEYEGERAQNG
jgi:hypothetical protein